MEELPVDGTYLFSCPDCDEEIVVDVGMRELILLDGCVICDRDVSNAHFDQLG